MLVTLCSTDIEWENAASNLKKLEAVFSHFSFGPRLVVLPEMFSTGFTMNPLVAEDMRDSASLQWMKSMARKMNCAIVGSIAIKDDSVAGKEKEAGWEQECIGKNNCEDDFGNGKEIREMGRGESGIVKLVNRAFFVYPNGSYNYYDKRHLFRMGEENGYYMPGEKKTVVEYEGIKFNLNICYDLRFPVWSRSVGNEYDVLINVANFPESRIKVTEPLVKARAIENQVYMLFVNRVGEDMHCKYCASSRAVDYKGDEIGERVIDSRLDEIMPGVEIINAYIDIEKLRQFREKFPAWQDADDFKINV